MRLDGARNAILFLVIRFSVMESSECTIEQVRTRMITTADTLKSVE